MPKLNVPDKLISLFSAVIIISILGLSACSQNPASPAVVASDMIAATPTESTREAVIIPTTTEALTEAPLETNTPVVWMEPVVTSSIPPSWTPAATFTPTPSPTPSQTPTPGPSPWFVRKATFTATVTKTRTPQDAVLRIVRPGLYSKIVSPYKMEAMITRGEDGFVYLSLIGEDQRLIYSQDLDYRSSSYNRFLVVPRIEFSIPSVAETARLVLETRDLFGRVMALSSVDIVLLSIGDTETNPSQRLYESFMINNPGNDAVIQGGRVNISAKVAPLSAAPLLIELIGENGEVISSREVRVNVPQGDQTHISLVTELSYHVDKETNARVVIRQESGSRIPGTVALSSVAVTLFP